MKNEEREESKEIEVLDEGVDRDVQGVAAPCCYGASIIPIR